MEMNNFIRITTRLAVGVSLLSFMWRWLHLKKLLLPGPKRLPFFGNFLQLSAAERPVLQLSKWAATYGPIYMLKIFGRDVVVVSGADELRQIGKNDDFSGRPSLPRLNYIFKGKDLLFSSSTSPGWKTLRQTAHRAVQHYDTGMLRIESNLEQLTAEFVDKIKSYNGEERNVRDDIQSFVTRATVLLECGKYIADDDKIIALMRRKDACLSNTINPLARMQLDSFPFLIHTVNRDVLYKISQFKEIMSLLWTTMGQEAADSYDANDANPTCAINALRQPLDPVSRYYDPVLDEDHARGLFTDLMFAGTSTTSSSFYAAINILAHNQRVQTALRDEVDKVIGRDGGPPRTKEHRDKMPYAQNTVLELLRYTSVLPTMMHETIRDTTITGASGIIHHIPAGTTVLPLFWALHHDEHFWGDPWEFRPERFDDNDDAKRHLMSNGLGIRKCCGERLARDRLFVFLTTLVQQFEIQPGRELVSCDSRTYTGGSIIRQQQFSARLIPRT
jgi:cytochrome P450